jgi:malate dehydrogenase (oxaloacetate-decarboxylating)(NADP+)
VLAVFGRKCLVQWEDFGNTTAFHILDEYKEKLLSFNDDIEGTASVVLAGLLSAAANVPGVPSLEDGTYLFQGAGEAGVGIANLISWAVAERSKCSIEAARSRIWLVDTKGLVTAERAKLEGASFAHHKQPYAHQSPIEGPMPTDLPSLIALLKPTGIIGVSAQAGAFSEAAIRAMAELNARPIIFALSNPTHVAECTAAEAIDYSDGKAVFASGSPFAPVEFGGKMYVPGQGNNAYIFPALGLAAISVEMSSVPTRSMYIAAVALAAAVSPAEVEATGCIYPPLSTIRDVSARVATAVAEDAYAHGVATLSPRPSDVPAHVRASMWSP